MNQLQYPSTKKLLLGIFAHISSRRRIQLSLLLLVMFISGGAELVSLGAVGPFLAVLSNPESFWLRPQIQELASRFGLISSSQLILPAMIAFVAATVISALIRLLNLWLNGRLAAAIGSDLSCEAYKRTLFQPYSWHVQQNSATVITSTTTQINITVVALRSLLQLLTSALVAVALLIGLMLINITVALSAATIFAVAYGILVIAARRELRLNSRKIAEGSTQQLKSLQEGLGAIRDVLLDGNQIAYLQIYSNADRPLRLLQAKNTFLSAFPRYAFEALGMVGIALLGGLFVFTQGTTTTATAVPLLGTLALGAQRLLPALQQIYSGWSVLKGSSAAMENVLSMLDQPISFQGVSTKPLNFLKSINFKKVRFRYAPDSLEVLNGVDLEVRLGERIGIIGDTGSGKSTLLDVFMGLLPPSDGQVLVDGMNLYDSDHPERLLSWRAAIAHVPQSIYLADQSIAENIALGVPSHKIDIDRVKKAAQQACISSFIEAMPDGYFSFVGERGIRLSGGQKQRIGIARALYKQCAVLVLDEATSALDTGTESQIMEVVEALSEHLTIVMIAHRLTTLKRCDRIIRITNGVVSADGHPRHLISESF